MKDLSKRKYLCNLPEYIYKIFRVRIHYDIPYHGKKFADLIILNSINSNKLLFVTSLTLKNIGILDTSDVITRLLIVKVTRKCIDLLKSDNYSLF